MNTTISVIRRYWPIITTSIVVILAIGADHLQIRGNSAAIKEIQETHPEVLSAQQSDMRQDIRDIKKTVERIDTTTVRAETKADDLVSRVQRLENKIDQRR